ncbi:MULTISPECIES: hypothetical protein [unclassified Akkermansia]|uniref:hypothetical protein n=1 Tax=unclassified Akkermansia TaxID=2608915 RepID=UPI00129B780B|nr:MULTISPECIES: hypothetical protein [unclassified Akkermansia]
MDFTPLPAPDKDGLMPALYHRDLRGENSVGIDGYFTYGLMDNDADGTPSSSTPG